MQINGSGYGGYSSNVNNQNKTESGFGALLKGSGAAEADPAAELREITKDGMKSLWSWQMKKLKEKIAGEVMNEMNLTAEQIAKMPDAKRLDLEKKIMDEVQKRLEIAMSEQANKEKGNKNELGTSFKMPPAMRSGAATPAGTFVDILA